MSAAALSTVSGTRVGDSDTFCPGCSTDRPFEQPPCDEHGGDCPELACVVCGWALIGPFEVAAVSLRPRRLAG
jgi:hypothetical protein